MLDVTDTRGNSEEAIVFAANLLSRSEQKRLVFRAIYRGKKTSKTVEELVNTLQKDGLSYQRILDIGKDLSKSTIIEQIKDQKTGRTAYKKYPFYSLKYKRILNLANKPALIKKIPTKRNSTTNITIKTIGSTPKFKKIFIDDIYSFKKVKSVKYEPLKTKLLEKTINNGFKKILGDNGTFKDWGGEKNDLFTGNIKLTATKRITSAIAFKGRATSGKLVPAKLGKNGDQIARLFSSPAQLFLVVYQGEIDQSVISQMEAFALGRAMASTSTIYFGVVDETDLARIIKAYKKYF